MTTNGSFTRFAGTPGYIVSGPLVDAVNCAIALERPLLLKGEPGTGKTVLARHVADGLGMPMLSWHIKSTSKAADGLYVYDTSSPTTSCASSTRCAAVWVNPEPAEDWGGWQTVGVVRRLFPMFPLGVDGLTGAAQALVGARA